MLSFRRTQFAVRVKYLMITTRRFRLRLLGAALACLLCPVLPAGAQTNFSIYSDQLNNGFLNWSWGTYNFSSTSPVHSGSSAISFSGVPWQAISFAHPAFNPTPFTNLTFWVNGGTNGGQIVRIYVEYGTNTAAAYQLPVLPTNSWRQFNLPFSALGVAGVTNFNRVTFQLTSSGTTNAFSLDDVNLTALMPVVIQLSADAAQPLRAADARWFGLNTAIWDGYFDSTNTSIALRELGTRILRFPGGSASDEYHWATGRSGTNTWAWTTSFASFVHIATNVGAQAMITANYGTGTPAEAAAWVRHANVTNHFAFKYWEIGNENYGGWETDTNVSPHDGYTYAVRAAQYIAQMKAADPTIKIGVPVVTGETSNSNGYTNHPALNARTGATNYGWTPVVLATLKSLGVTPDFLVHHVYPEWTDPNNPATSSDNDARLLASTGNWAVDAANLRQQLTDYCGPAGTNVELLCTENNSDAGAQGRQSTSLVNALYLADSLAQLMTTEFNGFIWWDLRNGTDTSGYFDPSLYGWRTNGDLGIIGGPGTRYPAFYGFKLMQFFARPGDTVLTAGSDFFLLSSHAARAANGSLNLLVINKDSSLTLNADLTLANFTPWPVATVRTFGIAQDEATRTNSSVPGSQDIATNTFAVAGTNFTTTFPPYSMTLFTFAPAAPRLQLAPAPGGAVIFQLLGQTGVPYQIQTSTNLTTWTSNATVQLELANPTTWSATNTVGPGAKFWRAVWYP